MNDIVQEKPRPVKYISWFLFIVSIYLLITGINGFLYQVSETYRTEYLNALNPGMSESDVPTFFSKPVSIFLSTFGLLYSIGLLISSIQFLKLNEWARKSLEILTWIFILQSLTFGVLTTSRISKTILDAMTGVMSEEGAKTFTTAIMAFIYVMFAAFIFIAGYIIKKLRSTEVRNAMHSGMKIEQIQHST